MSDEVLVPIGDDAAETARTLLDAAEKVDGVEVYQVRWQPEDNGFRVPPEVAKKAGLSPVDEEKQAAEEEEARRQVNERISAGENITPADSGTEGEGKAPQKRTAKKATSKRTATKKAAAPPEAESKE